MTDTVQRVPTRDAIALEDQWNAESVFASPEDWDKAREGLSADLEHVSNFAGTLGQGSAQLLAWLEHYESLAAQANMLNVYATMAYSCDTHDQDAARRFALMRGLMSRFAEVCAFAKPEIVAIGEKTLQAWLEHDADLQAFEHYLERILQQAAHLRSPEVEALLGALSDPFSNATNSHSVLANTDLRFQPAKGYRGQQIDISQGTIRSLLASPDRVLRQSAYENYADAHLQLGNTMASLLSSGMKQNVLLARSRGYPSALEAALAPENIPSEVFHQLISTFRANLPTWHRYWRAKRRMLGYEQLQPYDVFAPLTMQPPVIPFNQAIDWLGQALEPLGNDYVQTMRRGALEQRWVDKYPNQGKRMGAFSAGAQGTHPFIMMSYNDDVFGMSTLAHELGHSMHSFYAWQSQRQIYSRYSLFVAEVASNFNQAMLRAHLFAQNPNRDMRIALIEEAMGNFYRYFFVMPTLARFELEVHERTARGEALSLDSLNSLMAALFAEGYGGEVVMDEARIGITWAQFHTHIYRNFYVFQYATGISGAHALARAVLSGNADAAENYLQFLRAGGSCYPLDALRIAGVDLSTPQAVEETFAVLADLVATLEQLADTR